MGEEKRKENDPALDENIQPADIERTRELLVRSRKQLVDIENNQMNQMTERKNRCLNSQRKKNNRLETTTLTIIVRYFK